MSDPWTRASSGAARLAGHCTADILRLRAELAELAELEAYAGETFAGAAKRATVSALKLKRDIWRDVARHPARMLLPPVAAAYMMEVLRRG